MNRKSPLLLLLSLLAVFFSADRLSAQSGRVLAEAQRVTGDRFTVAKDDLAIQSEIAEKTEAIVFDRDRGTGTRTVTVEDPNARSIGDEGVRQLARVAIDIERAFGRPQDIEFAFDESGLAILQTRPITTIEEFGPAAGNLRIWDNSNIVESFAGEVREALVHRV